MEKNNFQSWELTDFNIKDPIILSQKFGQLKIMRSDDGFLILVEDSNYGAIDQTQDTPTTPFNVDTTLGFVLDIGIQKKKMLTYRSGLYLGTEVIYSQSKREVSQSDFDCSLFEKIGTLVESYFQSGEPEKELEALRLQYLINDYNNARLLFPNFYAESYLGLMRIIDALSGKQKANAIDFSVFATIISSTLNQEVYDKLKTIEVYSDKLLKASALFSKCLADPKHQRPEMSSFTEADKFVFSCFYSAYKYRNKFVHQGFPFPSVVKDIYGSEVGSGIAYISLSFGQSLTRFNRVGGTGLQNGDLIDIHKIVGNEAQDFKDNYFLLIPTWHFIKEVTRIGIFNKINLMENNK